MSAKTSFSIYESTGKLSNNNISGPLPAIISVFNFLIASDVSTPVPSGTPI